MTFKELNLTAPLLRAVDEAGYTTPSPIQARAIPPVLAGRDLLGCAQTGTGKTAAFALPILQNLSARAARKPGAIRALILTPTRELALQIDASFASYGKYEKLRHTVIFGGVGQQPQVDALRRGVDILVACPGRLNDLIGQGYVHLDGVEVFVLDEADRMLDMGFLHDVKRVIAQLPPKTARQTLLFSATMPAEIEQLADGLLRDPVTVKVDPVSSTVDRIAQSLYYVEKANKKLLLPYLIRHLDPPVTNALVFSRTKHGADKIARDLAKAGIPAAAIHGNKSQSARVAALEGFKAGRTRVLVATDIAARGIDISELAYVFNYDLPEVPETYVHRIGRTARAGADGCAVSFCGPEEAAYLAGIEKLNRKKIPVVSDHPWAGVPGTPSVVPQPVARGRRAPAPANAAPAAGRKGGEAAKAPAQPQPAARSRAAAQPETPARPAAADAVKPAIHPIQSNRKEASTMDQKETRPEGAAPLSASAKRRRRRHRAAENAAAQAAAQNGQSGQSAPNSQNGQNAGGQNRAAQPARPPRAEKRGEGRRGRGERQAAPQQPKFDPHFLTPQAASQIQQAPARPERQPARGERQAQRTEKQPARGEKQGQRPEKQAARPERQPARNERQAQRTEKQPTRGEKQGQRPEKQPAPRAEKRGEGRRTAEKSRRAARPETEDPGLLLIARRAPQQKFSSFEAYMTAHGGATAPIEDYADDED